METLWRDLRHGVRILLARPGFTLIAVVTLALGIGANTAIFTVVDAVLLRPLPYPEPERLVRLFLADPQVEGGRGTYGDADFLAVKERNRSFERVAAFYTPTNGFNLTGRETPEQIHGTWVTADFFETLRAKAALGSTFLPGDDTPGSPRAVVVSHAFWRRRLDSDPKAIGQAITLDDQSLTIVGVMPPDFRFALTRQAEVWAALQIEPPRVRPAYYLRAIGRLKPGVSERQAQADLSAIARQVQQQYPGTHVEAATTEPLKQHIVGDVRLGLSVLFGAVLFVLLIASVNVANLLLARGTGREKEMAVRTALGASRFRLMRQVLTESLLIAAVGGACGWLLAQWGIDLLVASVQDNLPRLDEIRIDARVLGFTCLISLLSGLVFGLAPAWQGRRTNLGGALKEGGRETGESYGRRRLRGWLVVAEFALTLMLLTGAGLMIRSFLRLQRVDPGFKTDSVLTMELNLPEGYREPARAGLFQQRLLERVQALPGVQAAAVSMALPPDRLVMTNPFTIEGHLPAPGQPQPVAEQLLISPDFFRALGIRVRAGRSFTGADHQDAPPGIIINQTMASRYFPNQDALGKRIQTGGYSPQAPWSTVVGVVDDVKYQGVREAAHATMYVPFLQNLWWRSMYLIVRTAGDPLGLAPSVRQAVWAIDRNLPVAQIKTMGQLMTEAIGEARTYTWLLGLFAAVAMVLASVGIYGVMSYTVSQRRHEIGIRMALGAQPREVLRLVLGQGLRLAAIGVALGLTLSFGLTRLMSGLLFAVSATDPATFTMIALLLIAVALLACYIPARRATKVDPMLALRCE